MVSIQRWALFVIAKTHIPNLNSKPRFHFIQIDNSHNSTKSGLWQSLKDRIKRRGFVRHSKKTQIPNPDFILFKSTTPTIQQNQVYGNPQKIELKEGKKNTSIQYNYLQFTTKDKKKIKLFEKTQIKNLEILA